MSIWVAQANIDSVSSILFLPMSCSDATQSHHPNSPHGCGVFQTKKISANGTCLRPARVLACRPACEAIQERLAEQLLGFVIGVLP